MLDKFCWLAIGKRPVRVLTVVRVLGFIGALILGFVSYAVRAEAPKTSCGRALVAVDMFSSAMNLAPRIKRSFLSPILVESGYLPEWAAGTYDPAAFLTAPGDVWQASDEDLLRYLQKRNVAGVIAGADTGIWHADHLANALNVPGNPIESLTRRMNKFEMHSALRRGSIEQTLVKSPIEAEHWLKAHQLGFPLVVKPKDGSGSVQVRRVHNAAELAKAIESLLGQRNANGRQIEEVIVMKMVTGTEYIVDLISFDGDHHPIFLWEYDKLVGASSIAFPYSARLVTRHSEREASLIELAMDAADDLEHRVGWAHIELMRNDNDGDRIIEYNGRLGGANLPTLGQRLTNIDGYQELIRAHTNQGPKQLARAVVPRAAGRVVFLVNTIEGRRLSAELIKSLGNLQTLERGSLEFYVQEGQELPISVDIDTSFGRLNLISSSSDRVEADFREIQRVLGLRP